LQNFALAIAEKVIRSSISELDQTIVATVSEALQRAVKSDAFTIFVNPDDYDVINEKSAEIVAGINGLTNVIIKTDPAIEKGGAKIESDNCIIDATIPSQFELIRDEILKSQN
jgi:flagellar assembly protein FliH